MRVIIKVLEMRFRHKLMPGHNLRQAKDQPWQRSNSSSATTAVRRATEQYLIKRSSTHLCEYKPTTKRCGAWHLSQIQFTARFHTLEVWQVKGSGGLGWDIGVLGGFNNVQCQLKDKGTLSFSLQLRVCFFWLLFLCVLILTQMLIVVIAEF